MSDDGDSERDRTVFQILGLLFSVRLRSAHSYCDVISVLHHPTHRRRRRHRRRKILTALCECTSP